MKWEKILTENFLNKVFQNIFTNLKTGQYANHDIQIDNIENPTLRDILKYKDIPGVLKVENICKNNNSFTFSEVSIKEIDKEIRSLRTNKASQSSDLPKKIISKK